MNSNGTNDFEAEMCNLCLFWPLISFLIRPNIHTGFSARTQSINFISLFLLYNLQYFPRKNLKYGSETSTNYSV